MKPEQQRIAIAEACGWEPLPEGHFHPDNPIGQTMPNYLNDLNAANAEIEEKRKDIVYLATEKAKLEERIKRLEEAGDVIKASLQRSLNSNEQGECKWLAELPMTDAEFAVFTTAFKAKETKP